MSERTLSRPLEAKIDLTALRHNYHQLAALSLTSECLAVVKSDAYGHGLEAVIEALSPEVERFAVACSNEIHTGLLSRFGARPPQLLVLEGFFHADEPGELAAAGFQIDWMLHSRYQLELLRTLAAAGKLRPDAPIRCWVKVNSGMNRLGFPSPEVEAVFHELAGIAESGGLVLLGIATHLACADTPADAMNQRQFSAFSRCYDALAAAGLAKACADGVLRRSVLNSAGLLAFSELGFEQVRPGIALYGAADCPEPPVDLLAGMSLTSRVIAVQQVSAGDTVGYGADYRADEDKLIGIVAAGYGDGYPRQVSTSAPGGSEPYVLVDGQVCRLAGRCSMDMLTVDLGSPDGSSENRHLGLGSVVELWGKHLPVQQVADWASTISYDLLTGVTKRVPRRYCNQRDSV